MSEQSLLPTTPPKYAVPYTYADNYIPVDRDSVKILINGSDLILVTETGEQLVFAMGAELASLGDDLIRLKFKDGTQLTSQEILESADLVNTTPNLNTNNPTENAQTHPSETVIEEVIQENILEEIVVLNGENIGGSEGGEVSTEESVNVAESEEVTLPKRVNTEEELIVAKKTAGDAPKPTNIVEMDNENIIVEPTDTPPVSLLQVGSHVDNNTYSIDVGFGNDEARQDASVSKQYDTTVVDLSSETANGWQVNVMNGYYGTDDGKMVRVIRLDDADSINSITGLPADYQVVKYGDPDSAKYGLAENEFAIIYPQNSHDMFDLHVDYNDLNGAHAQKDYGVRVVDSPSSLTDNNNNILLSSEPNSVHVMGGSQDDTILAGYGKDIYEGGGGALNTVDYSKINGSLTIDLNQGKVSGTVDHQLNDIQKIIGSDHGDTIIGAEGVDNVIIGGAGDNIIIGHSGNNVLDGGLGGTNTLSYENAQSGVVVDLIDGTAKHGSTQEYTDTVEHFHNVIGSQFDDILIGSATDNNHLMGGAGNDTLIGMNGFNTLDGGSGFNTASYEKATSGVTIDLRLQDQQVTNNGFGGKDSLINIQQIIGSNKNDLFYIGKGNTIIDGGGGNDRFDLSGTNDDSRAVLTGGKGNNIFIAGKGYNKFIGDSLYSASSSNIIDYSRATDSNGVHIDLDNGVVYRNGFGGIDQLEYITGVVGTDFDDYIVLGSKGNQHISTGGGNDTIIMNGSAGYTNTIDGGSVTDSSGNTLVNTVDYSKATGSVVMNFDYGQNKHNVTQNGFGGRDSLANIHNIIGSKNFDDILEGNNLNNIITTGEGNNTVFGSLGNDTLIGGSGVNTLDYSHLQADSSLGVTINALNKTVIKQVDGSYSQDSYTNFNQFVGSAGDDLFIVDQHTQSVSGGVNTGLETGFDTVDFSNLLTSLTIDLKNGNASNYHGTVNINLENINGVKVSGNSNIGHTIYGNDNDNVFDGGAGNDVFHPGAGSNTVNGGGGLDWIVYDDYTTDVNVDLSHNGFKDGTVIKADGTDTLTGITHIKGGAGNDTLAGGGYLAGGAGNNTLMGYGTDAYAHYNQTNGRVVVDLRQDAHGEGHTTSNGFGGNDTLINIDNVIGSRFSDDIFGNNNDNIIKAGAGDDRIYGSLGNDIIDGEGGNDTLDYSTLDLGHSVNINLNQSGSTFAVDKIKTANSSMVGQDQFDNINNIVGSRGNDIFTISDSMELYAFNEIDGGGGNANTIKKSQASDNSYFLFTQEGGLNLKNIQVLDFRDGKDIDTIAIDLDTLFQNYTSGSKINLLMDIGDVFLPYGDYAGWTRTEDSANQYTWSNGEYSLVCGFA